MSKVIVLNTGADINKLLRPGRHKVLVAGTYVNLPSIAAGKEALIDVEYRYNTAQSLMQTMTVIDGDKFIILRRRVNSSATNPFPSGTFTYGAWYKDADSTVVT